MYILDTDHLSLIQRNGEPGQRILAKIATIETIQMAVTVITYEEQIRGRLNFLSQAKTVEQQIIAYEGLQKTAKDYCFIPILPFDYPAALEHQRLRKAYPRLGNMDLKIAAIALVQNATLLTCNESDFGIIQELSSENWSIKDG
ncbi:type II toxin-antitoxin system VapC family toxin [Spirulina subsalsa]|uniref:type II toxin-antitoxin system VapC family toxin n=1 Tax=Spirulina subsalsa TaxID=54311 RepID=UPI0003004308|nr:type II toxin-antitoxin system VapC family toxin [Spirulina subsalsa]